VIDNLCIGMKQPNIVDFKLGTVPFHKSEKKRKKFLYKVNNSTSGKVGFRFCGMKIVRFYLNFIFIDCTK